MTEQVASRPTADALADSAGPNPASEQFPSREPVELNTPIAELDPQVAGFIDAELARQRQGLEMIASENHTPAAVMAAQGSVLTNKYAEGYPGRRYYGGCEHVDEIELIDIGRVKALFVAGFANVQPQSDDQANAAVMLALIPPAEKELGLYLSHLRHLNSWMKIKFSGPLYSVVTYGH